MQFFKDDNGNLSMMRLCCFLCVLTACLLAVIGHDKVLEITTLLGFGIGGKAYQKAKE